MSKRNLGKQAAAALKYNPDLNYAPVVVAYLTAAAEIITSLRRRL